MIDPRDLQIAVEVALARKELVDVLGGASGTEQQFSDAEVDRAVAIVVESRVLEQIQLWRDHDRHAESAEIGRPRGGRPATLTCKAVLTALIMLARSGEPVLLERALVVLANRISEKKRQEIGADLGPNPPEGASAEDRLRLSKARYQRVWRRMHDILEPIDPYPHPRWRRLTSAELADYRAGWESPEGAARVAVRTRRLHWVANRLIEVSIRAIPRRVRRRWGGSICLDETAIRLFARGVSKRFQRESIEPLGGWYVRSDERHRPADLTDAREGGGLKRSRKGLFWGHGAMFAVAGPSDPTRQDFPAIVVAMDVCGQPGFATSTRCADLLTSIVERGHPVEFAAADMGILPNARPEHLQLPARELGYRLVFDYRNDQLGLQGTHAGAILVEGQWYCPMMPEALIDATKIFRESRQTPEDERVWLSRLEQRRSFKLRPKERVDARKTVDMMCPALGLSPTARCSLRPTSLHRKYAGRKTIPVTPTTPDRVCTNRASVAFPPAAGAKYAQHFDYGLPEWDRTYRLLRSHVEAFNGYVKDAAYEGLGEPGRRRLRGLAAQTLLTALLVLAANLRKIQVFLAEARLEDDGVLIKLAERKPSPHRLRYERCHEEVAAGRGPPEAA